MSMSISVHHVDVDSIRVGLSDGGSNSSGWINIFDTDGNQVILHLAREGMRTVDDLTRHAEEIGRVIIGEATFARRDNERKTQGRSEQ